MQAQFKKDYLIENQLFNYHFSKDFPKIMGILDNNVIRMKNKIILIAMLMQVSSLNMVFAGEENVIEGKAPNGIESLETVLNSHEEVPLNKGPHGSEEYCYKTNIYIVYSTNLLGHGYELSKKPKNI